MSRPTQPLHLDSAWLKTLLEELAMEAKESRFSVAPNPCVGAAVLSAGRVVARGFHQAWGASHAEVEAFRAAAGTSIPQADWDTLVVTLEPCSSSEKTGPCTAAILESGVRAVVVGAVDPDPRHRGRGLEQLREGGVEVLLLEGTPALGECSPYFEGWTSFERMRRPRPWTIAKWAQTLTGQLSPPEDVGQGRWISSPESLAELQLQRAHVDAIVTGVGTVRADDPRLSVRPPGRSSQPPVRVVLDSALHTPADARLFETPGQDESAGRVQILCLPGPDSARLKALTEAGADVHGVRGDDRQHLNLREVQTWLWDHGYKRVLIEAGPGLLGAYLRSGFVDQLKVITGAVRGGQGKSLADWLSNARLVQRADHECGSDSVLEAFLDTD